MKFSQNAPTDIESSTVRSLSLRIQETIRSANSILVVSHIDPDGDALGSQLAFGEYLRSLNKKVVLTRDSEVPLKYSWLEGVKEIVSASSLSETARFDVVVALECPDPSRIGTAARFLGSAQVVNVDHHHGNSGYGSVNWIDPSASSVGEMLYQYFKEIDYVMTASVCENLYTAILTDTGRFRYSGTTARTLEAAAELVRGGADPRRITDMVYYNAPRSTVQLLSQVLCSLEYHNNGTVCTLTLTDKMLEFAGATSSESDGIVDFTLLAAGVQAGALLKEVDDVRTKVSLRTHSRIDASLIARKFNGGGHFNAAGCVVPLPITTAKEKIVNLLTGAVNELQ